MGRRYDFKVAEVTNQCITAIQDWFEENGRGCRAVIGISGGKDSTVVASLCVRALGNHRVVGVSMPNGIQSDIDDAKNVAKMLEIPLVEVNIGNVYNTAVSDIKKGLGKVWKNAYEMSEQAIINFPARLRMSVLYAVSQTVGGRVMNTCNLSEDYIGYSTRYGDSVGDYSPLAKLTVTEVIKIGKYLGVPAELVEKTPSDGLCGKSDEENIGFSYDILDQYIRIGTGGIDPDIAEKIRVMHEKNKFKMEPMPVFKPNIRSIFSGNF